MLLKVDVTGPTGQPVHVSENVQKEGELSALISKAIDQFRKSNPDAAPFDYSIKVSH